MSIYCKFRFYFYFFFMVELIVFLIFLSSWDHYFFDLHCRYSASVGNMGIRRETDFSTRENLKYYAICLLNYAPKGPLRGGVDLRLEDWTKLQSYLYLNIWKLINFWTISYSDVLFTFLKIGLVGFLLKKGQHRIFILKPCFLRLLRKGEGWCRFYDRKFFVWK